MEVCRGEKYGEVGGEEMEGDVLERWIKVEGKMWTFNTFVFVRLFPDNAKGITLQTTNCGVRNVKRRRKTDL